jgi:hypothetical protein
MAVDEAEYDRKRRHEYALRSGTAGEPLLLETDANGNGANATAAGAGAGGGGGVIETAQTQLGRTIDAYADHLVDVTRRDLKASQWP